MNLSTVGKNFTLSDIGNNDHVLMLPIAAGRKSGEWLKVIGKILTKDNLIVQKDNFIFELNFEHVFDVCRKDFLIKESEADFAGTIYKQIARDVRHDK